jgi:hypothetical protein
MDGLEVIRGPAPEGSDLSELADLRLDGGAILRSAEFPEKGLDDG